MEYGKNRPNGMMLVYPVVTAMAEYTHLGSFRNLWGTDDLTEEMRREVSLEANVNEKSVPLFLVHTSNDQVVDIRHALTLANAYKENGLMFEMHIYPDAPHGIALGNDITRCGNEKWSDPAMGQWIGHAVYWAEKFGK
ncbi:MAG: prolyl oligopeptidase family serine peptidase, partial [Clostridia bacterium]|nr:prolyl oligopeptidase family serine peptidase [Clostridia bacterium]